MLRNRYQPHLRSRHLQLCLHLHLHLHLRLQLKLCLLQRWSRMNRIVPVI